MRFAIMLATHNRARLLPRAIDSVFSQTYENWALYIIDDGSTDDTRAVAASYLHDPRVRYSRLEENRGKMHALNIALDRICADGVDWFTWMDDDDRLVESCLDLVLAEVRRHPNQGLFVFSVIHPDGTPITRMKVTGERPFCWNRMVSKRIAGDTQEFGAVRFLKDQRFHAAARSGMHRIFFGEFSLKAGSVFCDRPTKISEYLPDGITMTQRSQTLRKRTEGRLKRAAQRVLVWRGVLRRYPGTLPIYCVYASFLLHLVQYRLLMWLSVGESRSSCSSK